MRIEYNFIQPTDKFILVAHFYYLQMILLTGCANKKQLNFFKSESAVGVWHVKHKNQKKI